MTPLHRSLAGLGAMLFSCAFASCRPASAGANAGGRSATARAMADAIATVVSVDRELYTVEVVSRLQSPETELRVSQHWRQTKALPLPALMVKLGGEQALARTNQFTYGLISPWPINKANAPSTPGEKRGMDALIAGRASVFYEEEQLPDGRRWLTALYPDLAVGHACRDCHNMHPDSPRKDFKEGEVWGALRVRVLM